MSGTTTPLVTFDYAAWSALFPALAQSVNQDQATLYFGLATSYCDNTPISQMVCNIPTLTSVLNLLTAHIATLFASLNGNDPNPLVGRVSQATQGSVSVAVDMPESLSAAWFNQTPYGAAAWQMMAPFRSALYVAAPQVPIGAQSFPGAGGYGGYPGTMPFNGGFPWPR